MKILVTGSAGFIGSALTLRLLARGDTVIGIDNHNNYYDPALKEARLARHAKHPNYTHLRIDLADRQAIQNTFATYQPQRVVNLAAQAGVRYSIENPHAYIDSNIVGFTNILEGCRHGGVQRQLLRALPRAQRQHAVHQLVRVAQLRQPAQQRGAQRLVPVQREASFTLEALEAWRFTVPVVQ